MRKFYFCILFILVWINGWSKESIIPSITPTLFQHNDQITVTYDVTGTPLANLSASYIWVWIPGENIDAKYNVSPANSNQTLANNALFEKTIENDKTLFSITFAPADFFSQDITSAQSIGMLLKGNDWTDGQTTDYIVDFWDGSFQVRLLSPTQQPLFVSKDEVISIQAETPVPVRFELFINDISIDVKESLSVYSYEHTVSEIEGQTSVKIVATEGANVSETQFYYIIETPSSEEPRPSGIIAGINYNEIDHTKATLCLWAPDKSSVHLLGDFNEWEISPAYQMKKDGEFFWLELSGLTPGVEYGYQYLVNHSIRIADPYADKILDPDDQYIPATTYPDLKPYPQKALTDKWYFNRVAVLQTGQTPYAWKVQDFQKPPKEELVIYELLIRDFFGESGRNYQNLIDTISYLKSLGVNAIELMPIMEFNGNESWGYNPTFKFAPDKYYGPKDDLKAFIDKCHEEGIAVILDIVMNHHDLPAPYVLMDYDFSTGSPTAQNKWFNVTAMHPFNVFFDMNHESSYTKAYLDTVNHYWLKEYKVDGFRYDLSKGFTQTNSGDNVSAWGNRDASRIAILKRMADEIWSHTPDALIILEHFADNSEEKELAEYRAADGKGMLFWGNLNHAYNQNTMGYASNSDISWVYHDTRNWTVPHVIGYMESHDEERMMYRNLTNGAVSGSYDVKNINTALKRMEAAGLMFYLVPGPKMIWQFGEMGYDYSINYCPNGTISNDCRISNKPVGWPYLNDPVRKKLFDHTANLLALRKDFDVFRNGTVQFEGNNVLVKQITLTSQSFSSSPTSPAEMSAKLVSNFGLTSTTVNINFPHAGTWYEYYKNGTAISPSGTTFSLTLQPGEYKLFTDYPIKDPVTSVNKEIQQGIQLYPNPTDRYLNLKTTSGKVESTILWSITGRMIKDYGIAEQVDLEGFPAGIYVAQLEISGKTYRFKIIKN